MKDKNLNIDKEKCIHCGLCVKDCIAYALEMDENNTPKFAKNGENRCIECQHCLAVCPVGAISIMNRNPENSEPVWVQNPDSVLNLIKSRRSIRQYRAENLPKEVIEKLTNMLKYPPTGCNFHKLHFSIIDDIEVMDKFREMTNSKIKKILSSNTFNTIGKKFANYKDAFMRGDDIIFRNAPHMIVVSAPINAPCGSEDAIINLSYFELYAKSMNVGTLWCGFAEICLKVFPDLCEFLEIPDGYKPMYVMLFGPTDIKYTRCTQPEEYQISYIKDKDIKISNLKKIKRYFWNFIR